jgi:hypothetical protein
MDTRIEVDSTPTPANLPAQILQQSSHPVALVFHLLFKSLALFQYIFANWFTSNFVLVFVMEVVWISFDFWTVKNVTGRLLVGLRWWNEAVDGKSTWVFESRDAHFTVNETDSKAFWISLYAFPLMWCILAIFAFIQFHLGWMLITLFAIAMNGANLLGYYWCEKDMKQKLGGLNTDGLMNNVLTGLLTQRVKNMFTTTPAPATV